MTRYGCGHIDCILVVMTYKKSARITGMRAQKNRPCDREGWAGVLQGGRSTVGDQSVAVRGRHAADVGLNLRGGRCGVICTQGQWRHV